MVGDIALTAHNVGEVAYNCQMLLHTYLRVPHIDTTTVHGYHGKQYIDQLDQHGLKTEENHGIVIDREVDRIYDFHGQDVHVDVKSNDQMVVKVTSTATNSTGQKIHPDCVLWNPWIEKARSLADLNDDAYLSYVCVEPGLVIKPIEVQPGQSVTLRQLLDA
jgi:glucose-6-phosphate 1-epimerase